MGSSEKPVPLISILPYGLQAVRRGKRGGTYPRNPTMRTHSLLLASLVLAVGSFSNAAEVYPSHPVTMVLPFAAGGQTDAIARIIAEPMKAVLGQPIIMENISGAGGTLGMARVARAAPDGHTSILG